MKSTKAEMGVGTLIIFIAMLLVAAVAAGVLLQTAGSLQQKALITGQQTRGEISTNIRVIEVSAIDGTDSYIEDFSMQAKLSPGSDPIKLEDITMTFNTANTSLTLVYNGNENYSNATANAGGNGTFGVEYLIVGSNPIPGNIDRGDVIRVHWASLSTIGEDERVRINFIPKIGTATLVEFMSPDVMSTQTVFLYP